MSEMHRSEITEKCAYHAVHHLQDLGFHKLKILRVACRRATNHIVNSTIIVLTAQATYTRLAKACMSSPLDGRFSPRSIALENLTNTECFFMIF